MISGAKEVNSFAQICITEAKSSDDSYSGTTSGTCLFTVSEDTRTKSLDVFQVLTLQLTIKKSCPKDCTCLFSVKPTCPKA